MQEGVSWLQEEQSMQKVCNKGNEEGGHEKQEHGRPRYMTTPVNIVKGRFLVLSVNQPVS